MIIMNKKLIVFVNPFGFSEEEEYHYNAQIWVCIGNKWWYDGVSKHCKDFKEVLEYASKLNLKIEFKD